MHLFFICKQKTAYEMRIIDWSSDVCSSDLEVDVDRHGAGLHHAIEGVDPLDPVHRVHGHVVTRLDPDGDEVVGQAGGSLIDLRKGELVIDRLDGDAIGRASGREQVSQYV